MKLCYECLMKYVFIFDKTPLFLAIEKENIEMIQLLLENKDIDVNKCSILTLSFFNSI